MAEATDRNGDGNLTPQFQEAIAASLSSGTLSSPASPIPELHDAGTLPRLEIERRDRELETEKNGAEGEDAETSSFAIVDTWKTYSVYFKSFVRNSSIGDSDAPIVGGIGIAICDSDDDLIFELGKPIPGNDRDRLAADCIALIEALNAALSLNLTNVEVYFDSLPLFQYAQRGWRPEQDKIRALFDQVSLLWSKFESIDEFLVPRNDIKYAVKLAREAMNAQIDQLHESSSTNSTLEHCVICIDNKPSTDMFQTDNCSHRYCFSCMKQYVEATLLTGILPKCPYENCKSKLKIESCEVFLTPNLIEIFRHQRKEASIPATERVYCPFPKCSALMSKMDIMKNLIDSNFVSRQNEATQCVECKNIFCISCKVPWHENLSCSEYKRSNHGLLTEEVELKNLANVNQWRQCKNCSNMIERNSGCSHIHCRCGYEFCYLCGEEWKIIESCSCSGFFSDADEDVYFL